MGATSVLPLSGRGAMLGFAVEGAPPPPPNVNAEIAVASTTPDYFRAIGARVARGRGFSDQDHTEAPRVAIVNEAVWRNVSTDTWVSFKVFGFLPLTLLFALAQVPLLQRHGLPKHDAAE